LRTGVGKNIEVIKKLFMQNIINTKLIKVSFALFAVVLIIGLFAPFTFTSDNDVVSIESLSAEAYGGGGGDGGCCGSGGSTPTPTPKPPVTTPDNDPTPIYPQCVISANPGTITNGGNSTLTWTTTRATSASLNQGIGAVGIGSNITRVVSPTGTITYTMTVRSSTGHTSSCNTTVTVNPVVVPDPICDSFTANPTSIVRGNSSTLTWATTNATVVSINQGVGTVAVDGSTSVSPSNTTTYTLTATKDAKSVSCPVTVTVTDVPTPVCEITGNPHTITRGSSAQLSWTSQNAVSANLNQSIGAVAVNGNRSVNPNDTTTYTLTVRNSAGVEATCTKTITVEIPTPNAPICDSFTASPTTITRGQSTRLTWNTSNVISASINNAVGSVNPDGYVDVTPLQNTTYILTGVNASNQQVTCSVPVTVNQPEADITCAANVNFTASPTSIRRGDSSTLSWSTNGLTSVSFSNLNSTGLSGSVTVNPSDATTYTLIGKKGSQTIECPVRVDVSTSNGGGGGGSSAPKCVLKISDNKISLGERVTLKWDTTRATEVTLKDNHGKTLVDTDDKKSSEKKELYDGEITIRPEKDTTYTLVASKGSRDKTCKVSVDVEDNVVVTQVRDQQPLVTGIALTNVPYTGFDAGPFMTSVFYTLLAAWALYMAYVLVGRRNGMNVSAFTPATVTADVVPATAMFASKVTTPVFYQTPAPVAPVTATVGYEAHTDITTSLEAQAHAAHVLVSADALAYFIAATANEDRAEILAGVLQAAKASYPSEGGWVTLTAERMVELAAKN
jgi:hypothetical protein